EVDHPGSYEVTFKEDLQFPSVTDLLELAGGITASADIRQVQIRRVVQGREQMLTANLWEYLQQGSRSQDITLQDGDTIFVPTTDKIALSETSQLADANFGIQANDPLKVAVVGEVYRPGTYKMGSEKDSGTDTPELPRLTEAITLAGGIKPLADIRRVEVRRLTRTGLQQTINVDLWELLQTGDTSADVILQKGDTIVIPKAAKLDPTEASVLASASFAPATIRVNVVGEVKKPGVVEVPPNTPLNNAVLAAGGFDLERADTDSVQLIRLNPDGTVTKRDIAVDLAKGINEENNPALRSDDVIVVGRSGSTSATDGLGTILKPLGYVFPILRLFGL
ncbi:MAG: polysaccharide biosynthesis/export family protein, partial [Microcystaceae cyanobacterium]